jgi:hypothetical protein
MSDDTEQRYGFTTRSRNALSTPKRFRIGLFKPGASSASASNGRIGPDETSSCDEPAITLSTAFAHACGETSRSIRGAFEPDSIIASRGLTCRRMRP